MPRLRIVSIIPGIECTAPERTDTSSGRSAAPSTRPVRSSSRRQALLDRSARAPRATPRRRRIASTHACVVTVKPSGTGTPIRFISATLAPLPPSSGFIVALPSDRS